MTIATTYAKIVELVGGTSGITITLTELPSALPLAGYPIALVKVGPATWNQHASGLYRQVRTYTIDVYVKLVAEGVIPNEAYKACLTPLHNLGRTFVTNWTLDHTVDGIGTGTPAVFTDSGVGTLPYAGTPYAGFTLTLQVTEKAT